MYEKYILRELLRHKFQFLKIYHGADYLIIRGASKIGNDFKSIIKCV